MGGIHEDMVESFALAQTEVDRLEAQVEELQKKLRWYEDSPAVGAKVWTCKVGLLGKPELPAGADFPMRMAVRNALHSLTGSYDDFMFSGWAGRLTEAEQRFVDEKSHVVQRGYASCPDGPAELHVECAPLSNSETTAKEIK
jgi:hypothetical protein